MGAFYSLGITFDNFNDAEKCKLKFENYNLILNDSIKINSRYFINKCDYQLKDNDQFICSIFPRGLELPNVNPILFSGNHFYEIRNLMYKFLLDLDLNFNIAFYEFEGADIIQDNNPIEEIETGKFDDFESGEPNGYFKGFYNPEDFYPKRYFDGLIVSESFLTSSKFENFKVFKTGYKWLPWN